MNDEISVFQLKERIDGHANVLVLDVREPFELKVVRLAGAQHIPLGEVQARVAELPREREIVVLCHSGYRSERVARFLRAQGFNAVNLAGGIDAWAAEIDPSLARY